MIVIVYISKYVKLRLLKDKGTFLLQVYMKLLARNEGMSITISAIVRIRLLHMHTKKKTATISSTRAVMSTLLLCMQEEEHWAISVRILT